MTYNEFLDRFCGCHEDEVGNRPCDNGCMCDKCMTDEMIKLWKEVTTMIKAFKAIGCGLCIVFMAWLLLSWVDIVADNSMPNPHHSEYNAFVLMTKDR